MPGSVVVLVATPRQTDIPRIPCGLERKQDNDTAIDSLEPHSIHGSRLVSSSRLGRVAVRATVDGTPQGATREDGY